uniref:(northern house mosquito) hypothetical protein n=1 Tax=Culex pipiens TaxID=7175 RepID=A0A8D8D9C0_CULPI
MMGCRCRYQEEVTTLPLCFYYYSLPEWGILVLYTLGETETETRRDRERDGGGEGGTTHFIKHRYTATRMSALAAGTKRNVPPVGTPNHFHTIPHGHASTTFRRNSRAVDSGQPRDLFFVSVVAMTRKSFVGSVRSATCKTVCD